MKIPVWNKIKWYYIPVRKYYIVAYSIIAIMS